MNARVLNGAGGSQIAALDDHGVLTQTAFWQRVHGLSAALQSRAEQRWALICEDSAWFAAGLFALAHSGRTIVLPQAPLAGSLAASGAEIDAVLTDRPEQFPGFNPLVTREPAAAGSDTPCMPNDAVRVEFYTSGSTGAPKCVPKTFAQLRLEVEALEREWGARLGDALVTGTVPHHHLYGLLFRILWPVLSGRAFLTSLCLQPAALHTAAARGKCIIVSSPAFLGRVGDCAELPPAGQVAVVFSSGALLPDAVAEKLAQEWGHAVIEVYGSTETGGVAWRAWSGPQQRIWWRPINGVQTELRTEPAGERLWVRSAWTWQADWMPGGDLARHGENGRFVLLGRADDVVKFEDKRVSLSEIRTRLLAHGWVQDARLVLLQKRRTLIGAAVILNAGGRDMLNQSGKTAVAGALRAWLRNSYEAILIPRQWRFVDALPDNNMGKIEHEHLLRLFEPHV
ncbi:MAG: class I adenylate-forming enzyme family protein [Gammaproteobacteria bacterium]